MTTRAVRCSRRLAAIALAGASTIACAANFSQFPGWAEWFAANPPAATLPDESDRALAQRHRPRLFLPADHEGPIDFYADYIAHGRLRDGSGRVLPEPVTRAQLNALKRDPEAVFTHVPDPRVAPRPVLYARVDRAEVPLQANASCRFTFITYHAVFRVSGLPAGLGRAATVALGALGDLDDWHQLDHYTAATVVLDADATPIALTVQQHNYRRTVLFGANTALPDDGRARIDVAIRSNELYPHAPGRRAHRAVGFATPQTMPYLLGFGGAPWRAADDVTDPEREIDPPLAYLPPDDAFYVFAGYLGARRSLPGRDGPPGADYNIWPTLKPLGLQLLSGFWREGNAGDLERMRSTWGKTSDPADFARAQGPLFAAELARLRRGWSIERCAAQRLGGEKN